MQRKFGSRLALTAHINEKHETKKKIYECDMCEKKSSSEQCDKVMDTIDKLEWQSVDGTLERVP